MTASAKLAETEPEATSVRASEKKADAPRLPGVLFLLREAFLITWEHRMIVYGYTAWLLLPIIIFLFAQGVPSPYGNYLLTAANLLGLVLGLWVTAATVLYVALTLSKKSHENIDYTALGKHAWEKILILFVIQVLMVFLVLFGAILFIIPGIIAWVWTAFVIQEGILSQKGVWETFKHSRELTRGRFFAIFGRLVVSYMVFATIIFTIFTGYIFAGLHGATSALIPTLSAWPSWLEVGFSLVTLPLTPVVTIFHLLLYFAVKKSYSAGNV